MLITSSRPEDRPLGTYAQEDDVRQLHHAEDDGDDPVLAPSEWSSHPAAPDGEHGQQGGHRDPQHHVLDDASLHVMPDNYESAGSLVKAAQVAVGSSLRSPQPCAITSVKG